MVQEMIVRSGRRAGFTCKEHEKLAGMLKALEARGQKVLLDRGNVCALISREVA